MKTYLILPLLLLMAALGSCGHTDSISDDVATAEMALAGEDVATTRHICDKLVGHKDSNGIEATEMARLSILYMELNERTDDPETVELAAQCYRDAFKLNADSARHYYTNLPIELDKYAMTLATLVQSLDNPREIPADHDSQSSLDSIGQYLHPACHSDSIAE